MVQFNALLFDLDGTLLDTAPDFITSINLQLKAHNKAPLPAELIRTSVTNGSVGLVQSAFKTTPEEPGFEALRKELLSIYLQHLADDTALFIGLKELLDTCNNRSIPWGIVTNKPWLYTEATLRQLHLLEPAACVICPDHVRLPKPNPEALHLACQQIGIEVGECIFIGDHVRDIEAGKRAGMRTIAAGWGYIEEHENIADWNADWIVEHSQDLYRLLFED